MKTRHGFVSNSSSSSFVIVQQELTDEQKQNLNQWVHVSFVESMPFQQGTVDIQIPLCILTTCFDVVNDFPCAMRMSDNDWNLDINVNEIVNMTTNDYVDRGEFDKVVDALGKVFLNSNLNFTASEQDSTVQRISFKIT